MRKFTIFVITIMRQIEKRQFAPRQKRVDHKKLYGNLHISGGNVAFMDCLIDYLQLLPYIYAIFTKTLV